MTHAQETSTRHLHRIECRSIRLRLQPKKRYCGVFIIILASSANFPA